jgi:hypothetical protein
LRTAADLHASAHKVPVVLQPFGDELFEMIHARGD